MYALVFSALNLFFIQYSWGDNVSFLEARVKAVYILKIREFVDWPEGQNYKTDICVFGDDIIGASLAQSQEALTTTNPANIVRLTVTSNFDSCHILYVGSGSEEYLGQILFNIKDMPILTISDIDSFVLKGGIIGLEDIEGKIKISVNNLNAKKSKLFISSKLLQVARKVIDE